MKNTKTIQGLFIKFIFLNKTFLISLVLCLILIYNFFFTPGFFEISFRDGHLFGSLVDILKRAAPTSIIALGLTLVIASGGIDISVGSVAAIAGAISVVILRSGNVSYLSDTEQSSMSIIIVITVTLLVASLCGLSNGILISIFKIQPIIITLILLIAGRGIALIFTKGYVLNLSSSAYEFVGSGYLLGVPFPVILVILVFVILYSISKFTPFGLFIRASGGNELASSYSGVPVKFIKTLVYVISGVCAGLAGIIFTADVKSVDPNFLGLWIELDAILAVVIGGTAMSGGKYHLGGTLIGALIMQSLTTTILTKGIPVQFNLLIKSIVIVIVLFARSEKTTERLYVFGKRYKNEL